MDYLLLSLSHDIMGKPLWLWAAFLSLVMVLMAIDLGLFKKEQHEIGMRESLTMYSFYMVLACLFGARIGVRGELLYRLFHRTIIVDG